MTKRLRTAPRMAADAALVTGMLAAAHVRTDRSSGGEIRPIGAPHRSYPHGIIRGTKSRILVGNLATAEDCRVAKSARRERMRRCRSSS